MTLTREPLWEDEFASLAIVRRSAGSMLRQFPGEHNGALFHILLWPVVDAFGTGAAAARIVSLVAFSAAAALTVLVGERLAGRREGFAAGLAFAVQPFALYYGQEARMYALSAALVLASTLALLHALERPSVRRWVIYAVAVAAVGYTHDLALLCVAPQVLLVRGRPEGLRRAFAAALAGAGALLVPLVLLAASDYGSDPLYWVRRPTVESIRGVVGFICGSSWLALAAAAPALVLAYRRRAVLPRTTEGVFVAAWLAGPAAALVAVSYAKPLLVDRYLIGSIPAFAIGLAMVTFPLGRLGAIAFAAVFASLLILSVRDEIRLTKRDLPGAARLVAGHADPKDEVVVVGDARLALSGSLYYGGWRTPRRLVWTDAEVAEVPSIFRVSDRRPGYPRDVEVQSGIVWIIGGTFIPARNAHCVTLRLYRLRGIDVAKGRCERGG